MKPLVVELPVNGTATVVKMTIDTQVEDQTINANSQPDYNSMHHEIAEVADPVSFSELKDFYNLD